MLRSRPRRVKSNVDAVAARRELRQRHP